MNISELWNLADWIETEVKTSGVLDAYSSLHSALTTNAQPNQQKQPFEEIRDDLLIKLRGVPLHELTLDQIQYLEDIGAADHLGAKAADSVENNLYKNGLDIATAIARTLESVTALQKAIARVAPIRTALDNCIEDVDYVEDGVLIRIGFQADASITNVADLKSWSTAWYDIGRGLAMYHGDPPEAVRVVGAGRGSVIIDLAVAFGVAKTVAFVLLKSLEVAERVITIRLKAEELRQLKLSGEIAEQTDAEAIKAKEEGRDLILAELESRKLVDLEDDGDVQVALKRAVEQLLRFLEKGGEVDCVIPETDDEDTDEDSPDVQDIKELRQSFTRIRSLEFKIQQLEHSVNDDTPE